MSGLIEIKKATVNQPYTTIVDAATSSTGIMINIGERHIDD
jgi:hypothetical protein